MSDTFRNLLTQMKLLGASDLYLTAGQLPAFRVNGQISCSGAEPLSTDNLELFTHGLLNENQATQFEQNLEINLSHKAAGIGRFRVNIFLQKQHPALVVRRIPQDIPALAELGIPEPIQRLAAKRRGLILIAGPSGSGKSTTFASLLKHRSEQACCHIMTFEDPIEYVIPHNHSIVNQREIGVDTLCSNYAMNNALRHTPDVIGLGEIRSLEVLEQALNFADSGHLCIATIHASDCVQALERIFTMFPKEKREQALLTMGIQLRAIVAQQLIPQNNGQLVAAFEVLLNSPRVSDLIRNGDFQSILEIMENEMSYGMQTMDQSLYNHYKNKTISAETALEYARSYRDMRLKMRLSEVSAHLGQA